MKTQIGRLRIMGWIEGTTLLTLLGVAVPLKRLGDSPEMVSVMGPIHGGVFIAYIAIASSTVFSGGWTLREIIRVMGSSIIPFGTFLNEGFLQRKHKELNHV